MIKAHKVAACKIDCIVFCENPGQAKFTVFRTANGVGYGLKFSDIAYVRRMPNLDHFASKYKPKTAYSEEYLT